MSECGQCGTIVPEDAPMKVERSVGVFCDQACARSWQKENRPDEYEAEQEVWG